jgi:HD-GYP domain-containing protein (c-di-GMP phosphodiesterase class II)
MYRAALPPARALREMQLIAGSQLDPDVVGALIEIFADRGILPIDQGA